MRNWNWFELYSQTYHNCFLILETNISTTAVYFKLLFSYVFTIHQTNITSKIQLDMLNFCRVKSDFADTYTYGHPDHRLRPETCRKLRSVTYFLESRNCVRSLFQFLYRRIKEANGDRRRCFFITDVDCWRKTNNSPVVLHVKKVKNQICDDEFRQNKF